MKRRTAYAIARAKKTRTHKQIQPQPLSKYANKKRLRYATLLDELPPTDRNPDDRS
jgi:hypothetical protein